MNINCAIYHAKQPVISQLEDFVNKTPFLTLYGSYQNPMDALASYRKEKVQLYFIGIEHPEMNGMEFRRLLESSTRIVFITDSREHAATCFRLDALDYLCTPISLPLFLEAANKAFRWFKTMQDSTPETGVTRTESRKERYIYVKSEYRTFRIDMQRIDYIESLGDYVKIYCQEEDKPILCLYKISSLAEKLPSDKFIRVHRSFIVRKESIDVFDHNQVIINKAAIPVSGSYRMQLEEYLRSFSVS